MKIIHTADLHLESSLIRLTPDQIKERKAELFERFAYMVDYAVRIAARLFIIAGDLFDTENISKRAAERVANIIERHPGIDFLYLRGNHEGRAFTDKLSFLPKNLRLFGDGWTYLEYDGVVIAGRNELTPGTLGDLVLDGAKKNIVVLHGPVKDHSGASEGISLPEAAALPIDYLALGHYHAYTAYTLSERGTAVYCGTPEGRGFDECGHHGFVVIDTDRSPVAHTFCPSEKRQIRIVNADISSASRRLDIEEIVSREIEAIPPSDLVRVVLTGARIPELSADTESMRSRFAERFYYFEVRDESRMRIDPMSYAYDKSLKGEFIRLVLAREDIDDVMKEKIIVCGIGALLGEERDAWEY